MDSCTHQSLGACWVERRHLIENNLCPFLDLYLLIRWNRGEGPALIPNESNGCTRGGVNCATKIKCSYKTNTRFILVRSTWPTSSSQPPRLSSTIPRFYKRVHLEPLQQQVLDRDHLQPYNHKFYTRFTCNLTDSLPLTTCKGSTFQIKDFLNLVLSKNKWCYTLKYNECSQ